MYREIEETLTRELHTVADEVPVPPMSPLPQRSPAAGFWQPLLIAAAVVLLALAAVATVTSLGEEVQPAPRPKQATEGLSTAAPTIPYVVGDRLYVGGEQVPGSWGFVDGIDTSWVAIRIDGSYWWGTDAEPQPFEGALNQPPRTSPDGSLRAWMVGPIDALRAVQPDGGEEMNGPGMGLVDNGGVTPWVAAVTDDDLVVVQGGELSYVWRPLGDNTVVDLAESAPGQTVVGNTPAGLVVVDGGSDAQEGTVYLGTIDDQGRITRGAGLPNHSDLAASSDWLAWIEPGTMGGEAGVAEELRISRVDGSEAGVLSLPDGSVFRGFSLRWEDQDHLIAGVIDDADQPGVVRCSPVSQKCVPLDTP